MNVVELQRILGHADLSQITQTYSHLVAGDLFEAAVRLHSEEGGR
jgi:site-specific recombinase XerD